MSTARHDHLVTDKNGKGKGKANLVQALKFSGG
jgi:hypothetical protein